MFFPGECQRGHIHVRATKLLHRCAGSEVTSSEEQDFQEPDPDPAAKHLKTDYSAV
jgi:hypothetical protein